MPLKTALYLVKNYSFLHLSLGLLLNFRSDLILAPVGVLLILLFCFSFKLGNLFKCGIWVAGFMLLMLPWMFYTKHVTGKYRTGSTNSGNVFFVGLGKLPNNTWGVTPLDEDPLKLQKIQEKFGEGTSYLTPASDDYLKEEFISMVKAHPMEYLRKCLYSARTLLFEGFYPGVFDPLYRERIREVYPHQSTFFILQNDPMIFFQSIQFSTLLGILSDVIGRTLFLLTFLLSPIAVYRAFKEKNAFLLIAIAIVAYQVLICVFAYNMRIYMNSVLLLCLYMLATSLVSVKEVCLAKLACIRKRENRDCGKHSSSLGSTS